MVRSQYHLMSLIISSSWLIMDMMGYMMTSMTISSSSFEPGLMKVTGEKCKVSVFISYLANCTILKGNKYNFKFY